MTVNFRKETLLAKYNQNLFQISNQADMKLNLIVPSIRTKRNRATHIRYWNNMTDHHSKFSKRSLNKLIREQPTMEQRNMTTHQDLLS
jgi:hypothetical protein